MANKSYRAERIAQQIKEDLATILQFEFHDSRLSMLTIVDVEVSRDLTHAQIYFSLLDPLDLPDTTKALESANKTLRRHLASKLKTLRTLPQLHFHYDDSIERGNRISALINEAVSKDRKLADEKNQD